MIEQLAYENECPEGHMAPDEPTDLEMQLWREDDEGFDYEHCYPSDWEFDSGEWIVEVAQPELDRWRRMPDKSMQDCMKWLGATYELFYGNEYGDPYLELEAYHSVKYYLVEGRDLSLRLLTDLKEARIRHNSNGQYDDDIARYQEVLDSPRVRLDFECYLGELVEFLEIHGHDKTIFRLALKLIDHKLHGRSTPETRVVLREIYTKLLGFD